MNTSHKYKAVWWASPRCASRATYQVLKLYDFQCPNIAEIIRYSVSLLQQRPPPPEYKFTHQIGLLPDTEKYFLMMNVRNPYSRAVSWWHGLNWMPKVDKNGNKVEPGPVNTFKDFLKKFTLKERNAFILDEYELGLNLKVPDLFIRYEHLEEDVKKIPFLNFDDPATVETFNKYIKNNDFRLDKIKGVLKKDDKDDRYADWQFYYDQEAADMVYAGQQRQFEMLGYDKDSWKKKKTKKSK